MNTFRTKLFARSMKTICFSLLLFAVAASPAHGQTIAGKLQMALLDRLAPGAAEVVDIQIDERLLQTASKYLSGKEQDEAKIRELIVGLKGIYVKSFEFDKEDAYTKADLDGIRGQLRQPAWSRIIEVRSKREEENIEVYIMTEAEQVKGLVVISFAPRELTVINIIGPVDLDRLAQLRGQFGIPDLQLERGDAPKPQRQQN